MLLPVVAHDALWRCLCSKVPIKVARRSVAYHSSTLPLRRSIQRHQSQNHRATLQISYPSKHSGRETHRLQRELENGFFEPIPQSSLRHSPPGIDHEQLRSAGRTADYIQVQALVEYFVKILGRKPDGAIYEALLYANASPQYGSAPEVSKILEEMVEGDIVADSGSYEAALKALAVHPDQLLRDHILQKIEDRWFDLTEDGYHYIVAGLIRERQLELAMHWLLEMQGAKMNVSSWLYDMLVYSLCNAEEFDEAVRIMEARLGPAPALDQEHAGSLGSQGRGPISGIVWYHLLDTASRALHYEATVFAYNARVETDYLNPAAGICTNILTCAARHGDTKLATSCFNVLSKKSGNPIQLHHFETLIEAYVNAGDLATAITLLSTCHESGHYPTQASTRPIFMQLKTSRRTLGDALDILESLRNKGRPVPIAAINAILEGFVHHHNMPGIMHLYNSIISYESSTRTPRNQHSRVLPNIDTFNLMLRGCHQARDKSKAMFMAAEMVALNVQPDTGTYDRLILLCLHCDDDLKDTWKYVQEMREARGMGRGLNTGEKREWGFQLRKHTALQLAKRACEARDGRVLMLAEKEGGPLGKEDMHEAMQLWDQGHQVNDNPNTML